MNESVTILGLYRSVVDQSTLSGSEVWSLNDWYQFYPGLIPARVFNIHYAPHINEDPERFLGDWKAEYAAVGLAGGKLMVAEKIAGISPEFQVEVPIYMMTKAGWPLCNMPCSISLMIQFAGFLGYKRIKLEGIRLHKDEYRDQVAGIRAAIEFCRARGTEVKNPFEEEWKARELSIPEWTKGSDVNMGSTKHLIHLMAEQLRVSGSTSHICQLFQEQGGVTMNGRPMKLTSVGSAPHIVTIMMEQFNQALNTP